MDVIANPLRRGGITSLEHLIGSVVDDPRDAESLLRRCALASEAPLLALPEPAKQVGAPVSSMGRLDCKEASQLALARLSFDADYLMTIEDRVAEEAAVTLRSHGIETTPSGAAGVGAAVASGDEVGVSESSRVLALVTEGPESR